MANAALPSTPPWIADALARNEAARVVELRRVQEGVRRAVARVAAEGRIRGPVVLFGSLARGTFEPTRSDIDLMVEWVEDPFDLAGELQLELGYPVHVVQRRLAPGSLMEEIAREGMVLHAS
jgi:predicted nucleotidyltransferase